MKTNLIILLILFSVSCSDGKKSDSNLPENNSTVEVENVESDSGDDIIEPKSISSVDELFAVWEQKLIRNQIFDYVTERDCENKEMMMELYDKDRYPMHTSSKSFVEFDYNKDGIKDYVLNYTLINCVGGNGWTSDLIFMTSKDGLRNIDENLTNVLKKKYYDYVSNNYGKDEYVYYDKDFLITKTLEINKIINNECLGTFSLLQDGASCCPRISGHFSFDLENNEFRAFNIKREE